MTEQSLYPHFLLELTYISNIVMCFLFSAKVGRENIFQPTIGTENLHPESNDNGIRLVNLATSKNLIVKSTKFPHRNIHKYIWTSPDGIHNQIDHVLVDKRRRSSIIDVRL